MTENPDDGVITFDRVPCPPTQPEMTLRDWFAGQALAGLIARGAAVVGPAAHYTARRSFVAADAMLAERERRT